MSLTYINNNYIRSDCGTPVTGSIDMKGNTLYKVPDPVNPQDVATKEYADKMVNNVGKYVDEKIAHIKREVDDFTKLLDYVKKTIDERPHIIAAHASYHGDLIKGYYQFTFGGRNLYLHKRHAIYNGFLMPHSGYQTFCVRRFWFEIY